MQTRLQLDPLDTITRMDHPGGMWIEEQQICACVHGLVERLPGRTRGMPG
jgi:hypothetical protein